MIIIKFGFSVCCDIFSHNHNKQQPQTQTTFIEWIPSANWTDDVAVAVSSPDPSTSPHHPLQKKTDIIIKLVIITWANKFRQQIISISSAINNNNEPYLNEISDIAFLKIRFSLSTTTGLSPIFSRPSCTWCRRKRVRLFVVNAHEQKTSPDDFMTWTNTQITQLQHHNYKYRNRY